MTTRIIGTGSAVPKKIVTNDDLAKIMDTSDEWIRQRTGIATRNLCVEETTVSLCYEAAKNALENAGKQPEEIDLILVATVSPDNVIPCTACDLQARLGAEHATAFDLNSACSGFLFAMATAHAYLEAGMMKNALIVGGETLSKLMNWEDRTTSVLFGDGAGAAVLERSDRGIRSIVQGSNGFKGSVLACRARNKNNPYVEKDDSVSYVTMDGHEVYRFATRQVPKSILEVLEKAGCGVEDISYFLLHQANIRILEAVGKRLKIPMEKIPNNLDRHGNMSSASIPVLLDEMNRQGRLKQGDKIVLSGFGAGLTYGAILLEW